MFKVISHELDCLSVGSDPFSRGATALLTDLMHQVSLLLDDSIKTVGMIQSRTCQRDDDNDDDITCSDDIVIVLMTLMTLIFYSSSCFCLCHTGITSNLLKWLNCIYIT